jgi:hypothetical protein
MDRRYGGKRDASDGQIGDSDPLRSLHESKRDARRFRSGALDRNQAEFGKITEGARFRPQREAHVLGHLAGDGDRLSFVAPVTVEKLERQAVGGDLFASRSLSSHARGTWV